MHSTAYCLLHSFAFFGRFDNNLIVIFSFVICLVLISGFFRQRRQELWHETARLALEKGQPLPDRDIVADRCSRRWANRWSPWWELRRGLVLIAVGAALYYCLAGDSRGFAAIPAFIGVAYLLLGLFGLMRSDKSSGPFDRDPSDKP
jgi:hypothetical protein